MTDILLAADERIAAAKLLGASRVKLTTEMAIAKAKAVGESALERAEHVFAHLKSFEALAATDVKSLIGRKALTDHLNAMAAAEHRFWEALHGQVIHGVEILREIV